VYNLSFHKKPEQMLQPLLTMYRLLLLLSMTVLAVNVAVITWDVLYSRALVVTLSVLGVIFSVLFGSKVWALRRDLREGVCVERCQVIGSFTGKTEHLFVRTTNGTLQLANHTGRKAATLAKHWVLLTYARHAGVALQVEQIVDSPPKDIPVNR
jgi:hypothetical protein